MSQKHIVTLLRQISSSLPGDAEAIPDDLSGLSFAQVYLLGELFELEKAGCKPLSLSTLSQEAGFSKATVCATLKKLRNTGLVQMQMDDADNRRKEIALTRQARKIESSVTRYISALDHRLCAGISPGDLQTMEQALRVILQNVRRSACSAFE